MNEGTASGCSHALIPCQAFFSMPRFFFIFCFHTALVMHIYRCQVQNTGPERKNYAEAGKAS